ncbi:MAG TPA: RluA family pseudouridine synthase, partial [Rhodothermales bacterium]|nr:RluA family pseudouridine synthase [Rhodothermales bacterium]
MPDPATHQEDEWEIPLEVPHGYREDARLDVYLARFLPNASRAKVQVGIREGRVEVNGIVVDKPSYKVQSGDRILCRLHRPPPAEASPEAIPLEIVYEDDYLIIIDKAAGMVVHPAYGNLTGTLVNALLYHVGGHAITEENLDELDEDEVGLSTLNAAPSYAGDPSIRPGIVHRLDKDTSGLMVVAKDDETHRKLARQFEHRTIQRRYLGIVWGVPEPPGGRIEGDVARDPRDRKRMAVVAPGKGKHAVTHYDTVERLRYTALLQFRLETGRTHQIRVHARSIGHPLL